ncbi:regulatory YrvL family protein [Halobacillus yeomjeoni]|uniref:Regulatory YrvL family protein n=1 Tax=Halobacillus yeomjeoni TaxID=311194 RepID=A0A931HWE6_9BACI|nr:regulatory YrvL family protein [Halobacillus yeomjeoni]MBH0230426.1 regulatory YrvL family protein [Halobacillus yeomjeoni]
MAGQAPIKNRGEKQRIILFISLLLTLTLTIVFSGFFLGTMGFFKVMGVTYKSNYGVFLFALLVFAVGFFFELGGKFLKSMSQKLKPAPYLLEIWKTVLDISMTWLTIYTVDELVTSVHMLLWSEWIFALLLVIIDYVFDEKKTQLKKLA